MKLLLTSNGLSNDSIAEAFGEMIGVEPKDSVIAFIPTAANPERSNKDWLIDDLYRIKSHGYGIDIIDLAALKPDEIKAALEASHAIFVGGGSSFYLSYWMQKSGVFDILPKLLESRLYAGISAGSMMAGASLVPSEVFDDIQKFKDDDYYEESIQGEASDKALNLVDIVFRPHLNSEFFPKVNKQNLEQIVDKLPSPLYALDDNSALKVIDGKFEVVTEGEWLRLEPGTATSHPG